MKLTAGNALNATQRAQVLARFVYRLTTENGYPRRNPCGARVPAISDAQWIAEHAFYIRADGELSATHGHCEPAYMAKASHAELVALQETLNNPTAHFLAYCEQRRDTVAQASAREFWQRLAGSVRKSASMD